MDSSLIFGEIMPKSVDEVAIYSFLCFPTVSQLLSRLQLTQEDIVYALGSCRGRFALQVIHAFMDL